MKKLLILTFIYMRISFISAQENYKSLNDLAFELNQNYLKFKAQEISKRRFEIEKYHQKLNEIVNKSDGKLIKEKIGESFKGKPIFLVKFGSGELKILMWTQMHGDEPTASMAVLDLLNLIALQKSYSGELEKKISLFIVPILNPDGMIRYERRNYQEIDINRDALRLQTLEGKILKKLHEEIKPHYAFNLHDQYTNYSVGNTGRPSAISLLAPPFDVERNINDVRLKAIKVCVLIKEIIESIHQGCVARYDDEFEPRAFGDNFQKWGTSTVLIESGGFFNDPEKQEIRKLNFVALAISLVGIANRNYELMNEQIYFSIPENKKLFFDLLIRNCSIEKNGRSYIADIGISFEERFDSIRGRYVNHYFISDLGDLSTHFAFDTLDANYMKLELGKVYSKVFTRYSQLKKLKLRNLLEKGYTNIIYQGSFENIKENSLLDKMISTTKLPLRENRKFLNHSANLILKDKNEKVRYCVINGKVISLDN